MILKKEISAVGKFQKTHALKGELNAILDIDPEYFENGSPLIVDTDGIYVPYFISSVRPKGSTSFLIKIDGIDSEEEASEFVNKEIYILSKDLTDLVDDEYIHEDELLQYQVIDDATGEKIGRIEGIEDSTANILLIVDNGEESPVYIPYTEDFIKGIDESEKIIRMQIPDGLLDINKSSNKKDID